MKTITQPALIGGGVVLAALAVWWIMQKNNAANLGASAGAAAVNLADGVIGGTVTAAGSLLGVPVTDITKGQAAIDAGNWLDASLYLPAAQFIPAAATAAGAAVNDPGTNPVQPVGAWLGSTLYDLMHSKANGGIW